ncbi:MAG TPA: mechanosensitive ion channel family protein [Actinomycetota bacterium]|nr:mechanosensitive ion channel family protein [Actinomycetota bacterium]
MRLLLALERPDLPLFSVSWWTTNGIGLAVTLLIAIALTAFTRHYVRRFRKRAAGAGDDAEGRRERRVATVVGLIAGVLVVIVWFIFALDLLVALGVNPGPIIASAGIAGVALGFGAQTLVRDTIAGLFIFLEGQYDVGDVVDLTTTNGSVSGTVEQLSIRTTAIRQFDGTLSIVPNGAIVITNNRTRGWGRAIVDLRLALTEDPEKVRDVLEEQFDELEQQEPFKDWFRERPKVLGVTQLTDVAEVIRVTAETAPSHRVECERLLRAKLSQRLAERGFATPPAPVASPAAPSRPPNV